jgi:DNA-binding NtrC family response regulator
MTTTPRPRILVADDQADIRDALWLLLKNEGFAIEMATSPAEALNAAQSKELDAVLMDLNYARDTTSGQEGLDLLARLRALDADLPVVVMTAWATIDVAVQAMRQGARDFVQKPWENARLLTILKTQVELARALRKGHRLEQGSRLLAGDPGPLIAESPAMRPVLETIAQVGPSDANVLITGENGSGKGTIARALHAASLRAGKALVTVNVGGLSETLFESELFGHVKGAFTDAKTDRVGRFELADGGTLFLDEIANLSLPLQAKLLRVLETGEFEPVGSSRTKRVDVRILSATNADIRGEVAGGRFRQDLLFRINTIELHVPALRDRREDVRALAQHFLAQHRQRYRKRVTAFDEAALKALQEHAWPGNVRELDHVVERAVLMAKGDAIAAGDLGLKVSIDSSLRLDDMSLEDVEYLLIKKALARFDGNVSKAAEALGLSRSAMYRRLQRYGL